MLPAVDADAWAENLWLLPQSSSRGSGLDPKPLLVPFNQLKVQNRFVLRDTALRSALGPFWGLEWLELLVEVSI